MYQGFIKVAAAVPYIKIANCEWNEEQISNCLKTLDHQGVDLVCLPELSLTGCTCGDLFKQQLLMKEVERSLNKLLETTSALTNITAIVGLPVMYQGALLNAAAVIRKGALHAIVAKSQVLKKGNQSLFTSGSLLPQEATINLCNQTVALGTSFVFEFGECNFSVVFGNDLKVPSAPSKEECLKNVHIALVLGNENENYQKVTLLENSVSSESARYQIGYVYACSNLGESTGDVVYGGRAYIAEDGKILTVKKGFGERTTSWIESEIDIKYLSSEKSKYACIDVPNAKINHIKIDYQPNANHSSIKRHVNPLPFIPNDKDSDIQLNEILNIQAEGLAQRIVHTNAKSVVLGISGGLDSTLALLVCVSAFDRLGLDRKGIVGITMPGFGTTDRTYQNALMLMDHLGISRREISIKQSCEVHFNDIGHDITKHDVTYENGQARERTQILMDVANQVNGFVVGTGDLSELALGWATYNGDHMSMYGVNASVPKTLIKHLVVWIANTHYDTSVRAILLDITDTPISPELIPAHINGEIKQKTEDLVGPYELHDFFIYHTLRFGYTPKRIYELANLAFNGNDTRVAIYDKATIKKWLTIFFRRFFAQQFKRNCLPDGPSIGECSLSPRGYWQMPSDAHANLWLKECESL